MKIKNIKISKLFGIDNNDFDIDVYPKEHITLLYGFNGEGKTTIIKLVVAALKGDFKELRKLSFLSVEITFEDNYSLTFKKDPGYKYIESGYYLRLIARRTEENIFHPISIIEKNSDGKVEEYKFRIAGPEVHIAHTRFGEYLDKEHEVLYKLFYEKLHKLIDIRYIFADRDYNRTDLSESAYPRITFLNNNVKISFSTYEAKILKNKLSKFLDEQKAKNEIEDEIEAEFSYVIPVPDKINEINNLLIGRRNNKDLYERLDELKTIINSRFQLLDKKIDFSYDEGLFIVPSEGISDAGTIEQLSSGEKKLICLFAEVLLTCDSNAVVFVDEPEVSLHVDWQNQIVSSLLEICEKYNIQIIIMTHSPDIIGEYIGIGNEIVSKRMIDD